MKVQSNKVKDIRDHYAGELQKIYPKEEAVNLLEILFEELLGISKMQLLSNPDIRISESEMLKIHFAFKKLLNNTPVQHITGVAHFYNLKLHVDKHVLIPRPETEELIEWILKSQSGSSGLKLLDIGTGSGAISLALKKAKPGWDVEAIDISTTALEMAQKNADHYNLEVKLRQCDILENDNWNSFPEYDIIVSNPPYVTQSDKRHMHANVLIHEPGQALYVSDEDPLIFYTQILSFAQLKLRNHGRIFFEINENFGPEIRQLFEASGFIKVEIRQDLQGKDRMAFGLKK